MPALLVDHPSGQPALALPLLRERARRKEHDPQRQHSDSRFHGDGFFDEPSGAVAITPPVIARGDLIPRDAPPRQTVTQNKNTPEQASGAKVAILVRFWQRRGPEQGSGIRDRAVGTGTDTRGRATPPGLFLFSAGPAG